MVNVFIKGKNDPIELAEKKDIINPNLVYGTPIKYTGARGEGTTRHMVLPSSNSDWNYVGFYLNTSFKRGDYFTITAKGNLTGPHRGDGQFKVSIFSFDTAISYLDGDPLLPSGRLASITVKVWGNSSVSNPPVLLVYSGKPTALKDNQLEVDYLKVGRGTIATPWCPAYEDLVLKSDYDALNARLTALESKSGGRKRPKPLVSRFYVLSSEREVA